MKKHHSNLAHTPHHGEKHVHGPGCGHPPFDRAAGNPGVRPPQAQGNNVTPFSQAHSKKSGRK